MWRASMGVKFMESSKFVGMLHCVVRSVNLLNTRQMKAVELLFERSNLQRGSLAWRKMPSKSDVRVTVKLCAD
jgi:hypothetical protein